MNGSLHTSRNSLLTESIVLRDRTGGISEPSKLGNCGVILSPNCVISVAFSVAPSPTLRGETAWLGTERGRKAEGK